MVKTVELKSLFDIGSSKRVFQAEWKDSGIPFYRAREIVQLSTGGSVNNGIFIDEKLYENYAQKYGVPKAGDIMVTGVGTLGVCYIVKDNDKFYFKDGNIIWLRKIIDVNPQYVALVFTTPNLKKQIARTSAGSTVGTLTISDAEKLRIPLPPLSEQNIIVKIFDMLTSIIDKRKLQITLLEEAEKSLFIEMFGDNVTIMKWNQHALGNIADIIVGVVIKPAQYYSNSNDGVKAFRSLNIAESKIKDDKWVYFSAEGQNMNKKSILKEGDVLVVRSGKPGTACVVTKEYEGCNAIDIIIARPNYEYLESEYLCRFTNSNCCKEMIKSKTNGVAQQHFNVGAYKSLMIPVPPLSLQNDFASRISLIEEHRTEMQTELKEMEELKSALMQEYFG